MSASKPISSLFLAWLLYGFSAVTGSPPSISGSLPSYATAEETIHGRIRSIDGQYRITVRDVKGYLDHIALHRSTIFNPPGLTLAPLMSVTIFGYNAGSVFMANEIDTPYGSTPRAETAYTRGYTSPSSTSGYGASGANPLTIFNSPSYPVIMPGGYSPLSPYGYGSPYRGYPIYNPFGFGYSPYAYGFPTAGNSIFLPPGFKRFTLSNPVYGPGYWPYH